MKKATKKPAAKGVKLKKKTVKDLASKKPVKGGAPALKSVRWCRD